MMNKGTPPYIFSTGQAAKIAGVAHRTVDYWATIGLIVPSVAESSGTGKTRLYDFSDLVALRVARELRNAGISAQALRAVIECLRADGQGQTLTNMRLVAFGSDVVLVRTCRQLDSVLRRPGQGVFAFILDLQKTEQEVKMEAKKQPSLPPKPLRAQSRKLSAA